MKKRIWILLLTAALLFCLSSCQKDGDLAGALSGRLDGIGAQQPAPGPEKEPEKEKEPETNQTVFDPSKMSPKELEAYRLEQMRKLVEEDDL